MCNIKFNHLFILVYINIYTLLNILLAWFGLLRIVQLHEKHLNSIEGKEYEKRKLKCISTEMYIDQSVSLNFLVWVVYKVKILKIFL